MEIVVDRQNDLRTLAEYDSSRQVYDPLLAAQSGALVFDETNLALRKASRTSLRPHNGVVSHTSCLHIRG